MNSPTLQPEAVPDLDQGLNLLETPAHRTTALHEVALSFLEGGDGSAVWIDARGNAANYLIEQEHRPTPDLEIARAFTAYQHYELVRTLPGDLPRNLELIVLPCVDSLYADPDVPDWVGEKYLESALAILGELADIVDVPILVSSLVDSPFIEDVRDMATKQITFERTGLGYRFETEDWETTVYWGDGYWQTTIPYWVELLGSVDEATPAITAIEQGMMPGTV